jgi:LPXTG-motif cell wall-anchored protein
MALADPEPQEGTWWWIAAAAAVAVAAGAFLLGRRIRKARRLV